MALTEQQRAAIERSKAGPKKDSPPSPARAVLIAVAIAAAAGGGWYAYVNYSESARQEARVEAAKPWDRLVKRWKDARSLAASTARMALPAMVKDLQSIRREAGEIEAPGCFGGVATKFSAAMQMTVDGFIHFMSEPDEGQKSALKLIESDAEFAGAELALKRCRESGV